MRNIDHIRSRAARETHPRASRNRRGGTGNGEHSAQVKLTDFQVKRAAGTLSSKRGSPDQRDVSTGIECEGSGGWPSDRDVIDEDVATSGASRGSTHRDTGGAKRINELGNVEYRSVRIDGESKARGICRATAAGSHARTDSDVRGIEQQDPGPAHRRASISE